MQFRIEFRKRFPGEKKRRNRQHAYQAIYGALARAKNILRKFSKFQTQFTAPQTRKLVELFQELLEIYEFLRKAA